MDTCENRIFDAFANTEESLREILDSEDVIQGINEYGLSFELVKPENGGSPFYRWLLSWGGPSDELRFYRNRTDYHFMDWFDGAHESCGNNPTICEIRELFEDLGLIEKDELL
jgi:hypothetical protein